MLPLVPSRITSTDSTQDDADDVIDPLLHPRWEAREALQLPPDHLQYLGSTPRASRWVGDEPLQHLGGAGRPLTYNALQGAEGMLFEFAETRFRV